MNSEEIKNSINYNMSDFIKLWKADTDPNKPKILRRGGVPTKKAIQYNKKLIRQGKTSFYLKKNVLYNPITKKETTAHIDKRSGKIKKSYLKKFVVHQGTTMNKEKFKNLLGDGINRSFTMPPLEQGVAEPTFFDNEFNLRNNLLLNLLTKNLSGKYRIIIKRGNQKIRDAVYDIKKDFIKESDFMLSGSPVFMVFNGEINENGQVQALPVGTRITFIITKEKKLPYQFYAQTYRRGITNCLLTPIKDYFLDRVQNSKTKQGQENYKRFYRYTLEFIDKFRNGVPEKCISQICEKLNISIEVVQPFTNKKYLEIKSSKRNQKIFKFINTELNHVDLLTENRNTLFKSNEPEIVSPEQLLKIEESLNNQDKMYIYKKNLYGISSIRTLDNNYILENTYYDIVREFENETGLRDLSIDALQNPELQTFINDAVNFNGTVDFKDTTHLRHISKNDEPPENLEHIDMIKAYSKFYESEFYQGFSIISHFRKLDKAELNGYYYIDTLDLSNADLKFKSLNKKLNWFKSHNIYTLPELKALEKYGGKYTVSHGAVGTKDLDFRFNEDMLNRKEEVLIPDGLGGYNKMNISYYAKYCGCMASLNSRDNFYMKGNKKFLQTIQQDEDLEIYYSDYDNESRIGFNKKYMYNKKYITGQITAYQRLNMLEQLLKMDLDKIVRVCVDGIYYEKHKYENLENIKNNNDRVFSIKDEMTFQNHPTDKYLSNVLNETEAFDKLKDCKFKIPIQRDINKFELFQGAGGTGKTHYNLVIDRGLINPVYVAPTHKLATEMHLKIIKETGRYIPCIVLNRLLEEPYKIQERYIYKWRHYIIDEASMITEGQKIELMESLPNAIFMGDLGHQLNPVVDIQKLRKKFKNNIPKDYIKQMTTKGFDKVHTFTKNYRFKCDKLKSLSEYLRKNKDNKIDYNNLGIQTISIDALKKTYKKEDMILRYHNELKKDNKLKNNYTQIFKDIPKYKITSNYTKYKNGEIIYEDLKGFNREFRHSFTVHSVQGITFKEKIFIDINGFDNKLFYTALSRAEKLNQIYIIEND